MTGGYEFEWNGNTMDWAFKDFPVMAEKVFHFGEFQIGTSLMVPKGTVYLGPSAPECVCQTSPVDCKVHADV